MNCIKIIQRPKASLPSKQDLIFALMTELGAKVSSMPRHITGQKTYHDRWELFNPAKVRKYDILPEPWNKIYEMHMRKDMKDCRDLKYRYVHAPVEILPQYPRVPCKGVFCLSDRTIRSDRLKESDLIFIGNEVEDEG